jgi:hypothetical protein
MSLGILGILFLLVSEVIDPWLFTTAEPAPPPWPMVAFCCQVSGSLCLIMAMAPVIKQALHIP